MAIRKLCVGRGCDALALEGLAHCADHEAERLDKLKAARVRAGRSASALEGAALYQSKAWRAASYRFLERYPLCMDCGELGAVEEATEVDHIERHRGDRKLFWDRTNWQALCHRCHSRKTAREVFHGA